MFVLSRVSRDPSFTWWYTITHDNKSYNFMFICAKYSLRTEDVRSCRGSWKICFSRECGPFSHNVPYRKVPTTFPHPPLREASRHFPIVKGVAGRIIFPSETYFAGPSLIKVAFLGLTQEVLSSGGNVLRRHLAQACCNGNTGLSFHNGEIMHGCSGFGVPLHQKCSLPKYQRVVR